MVTGANQGIGYALCLQLAVTEGVSKVILACRDRGRAEAAARSLAKESGRDEATFQVLVLDASDVASCVEGVRSLDGAVDRVCLNAGGMLGRDGSDAVSPHGATKLFTTNVLGHAALVEALRSAGRLAADARIVFCGSEASRGMDGMFPVPEFEPTSECFQAHMTNTFVDPTGNTPIEWMMVGPTGVSGYGYVKAMGALYFKAVAERLPAGTHVLTVSPGSTAGTSAMSGSDTCAWCCKTFCLQHCLMHSPSAGAHKLYRGLVDPEWKHTYSSGSSLGAKDGSGASPHVDVYEQAFPAIFNDANAHAAYDAVHHLLAACDLALSRDDASIPLSVTPDDDANA